MLNIRMKSRATKATALLLAVCVLLVGPGCARNSSHSGHSHAASASSQSQGVKPTLDIDVKVEGKTATVQIKTDLELSEANIGQARKPGQGHIHFYLNDGEKQSSGLSTVNLTDLPPGKHTVKVSLHNNDHTPYDVTVSRTFEVAP